METEEKEQDLNETDDSKRTIEDAICENCIFYKESSDNGPYIGLCCLRPPTIPNTDNAMEKVMPEYHRGRTGRRYTCVYFTNRDGKQPLIELNALEINII